MLYRKYRPKAFDEVVGQDHVVKTLQGALQTGRVGHAYLFCGPRGTGKTTLARIFSKSLNCTNRGKDGEPCNECANCLAVNTGTSLDLIEIDAASNRGIDEIRSLKESAQVAGVTGGYKVFLIDEVHMLTKDAFNALLKVLEEPPQHVVFILATTEPHKILATVLSRVQRFDFRRLSNTDIVRKLQEIASQEKISIEQEALAAIATSADGALRDAEVSLTKLRAMIPSGTISAEQTAQILGLIPHTYHPQFLQSLATGDKAAALQLIYTIHDAGLDLEHFTKDFLDYTRKVLLARVNLAVLASVDGLGAEKQFAQFQSLDSQKLIKIITVFTAARSQIRNAPIPQLPLELAVMEL